MNFNRRGFIRSSVLSAAGVVAGTSVMAQSSSGLKMAPAVIKRKFGKSGFEIPVVSFGVMRSDSANLIKMAMDMGYVHFDTAYSYMGGRNEQMLGDVLKNYPRDSFMITTKIPPDGYNRDTGVPGAGADKTKEAFIAKFEESLQRLQMDYVDILYLHGSGSREMTLAQPILEALTEMKKQGKAKLLGVSTHNNEPEVIQAAVDSGVYDVVLTSYNFKHARVQEIKEKIAIASDKGLGVVVMKPMAGAFMDQERQRPINCKAALKWVLADPNVHTTIPGITTFEMLTENFSVMEDLELTQEEKDHIEEAKLVAGLYCGGCTECTSQCKKNLPVHDIMRAYMYAYGYRDYNLAYSVFEEHGLTSDPCSGCDSCTVNCPQGKMVSQQIASVARIRELPKDMLV